MMCLQLTKQNPGKEKAFLYLLLTIHIQKNVFCQLKQEYQLVESEFIQKNVLIYLKIIGIIVGVARKSSYFWSAKKRKITAIDDKWEYALCKGIEYIRATCIKLSPNQ